MAAKRTLKLPDGGSTVNTLPPARPAVTQEFTARGNVACERCSRPWHIGAVREGEEVKRVNFAQLETMAKGVFSAATLRTYSRKDRGAGKFYDHMTIVGSERRYSACESRLVIDQHRGVDTAIYERAIAEYDRRAPTTRRLEAVERQLMRDFAEIAELEREPYSEGWMLRWKAINARIARTVQWIDRINRNFGLEAKDGMLVTDRFTTRRAKLRALFPEFSDRAYRKLFENTPLAYWSGDVRYLLDEGEPRE